MCDTTDATDILTVYVWAKAERRPPTVSVKILTVSVKCQ